jgi:hypothetical protein
LLTFVFQIFKDATLFFSRGTPNLATVIPAMDHIDKHLATSSLNRTYVPAIRVALAVGKAKLNRYYNLTDSSEVYRIAMGSYMPFSSFITVMLNLNPSPPSPPQASILQKCKVGARMDRSRSRYCSR